MKELEGRVAVVTGAGSGIGKALARVFASQGMNVVIADIEEELIALRRQFVNLSIDQRRLRLNEWFQVEGTITYRDNAADAATIDIWSEMMRTKGEIRILEDERDHLRFVTEG